MKYKKVNVIVRDNQLLSLLRHLLVQIMNENQKSSDECLSNLEKLFNENGKSNDILIELERWLLVQNVSAQEIMNIRHIVDGLDSSPTDTEVLEDLPDLEEDSLGVDGGGE
jgi:hypothetical protein